MSLYIKSDPSSPSYQWHVGESLPTLTSRVITFQADGDELEVILEALRRTSLPPSKGTFHE